MTTPYTNAVSGWWIWYICEERCERTPPEAVTLRIVRRTPDEYTYEYLRGEQTCATGVLVF